MAVIATYGEIINAVFDGMVEASERGEWATKILMSQRQYDVFRRLRPRRVGAEERWFTFFELPIVICPDCDLYVVYGTIPPPGALLPGNLSTLRMRKPF